MSAHQREVAQRHAELAALGDILDGLLEREAGERLTSDQIADMLGMSRAWVRKVEAAALAKLAEKAAGWR